MKTVVQLQHEGYGVSVYHLRHRKGRKRKDIPRPLYDFDNVDDVNPKGGKTLVVLIKDGECQHGEAICCDLDHYNKAEGVSIALGRALKKFDK